jgi:cysteine synthase A
MNILKAIGNTSLVRLRNVVPAGCAQIWAKLEWENPTGSMKDRMAQAVIARAEQDGRLKPGGTVVEYTGGSTGTSLALVCAAMGYGIHIVTSDAFSKEKRDHMAALGARLTLVPSEGGLTTKKLILDMIEAARAISREPHTFWIDQLNNHDSIGGYYALGEEIWRQTNGKVDAFVHSVGTAASSRGVATVLKRYKPGVKIIVVEPAESSVLLSNPPGPHKIEGVGIGYTPPLFEPSLVRRDPGDQDRRCQGDDATPGARGSAVRRNFVRRERPRRDPSRPAARSRGGGRHADGRFGAEVPEHGRVPERLAEARVSFRAYSRGISGCQTTCRLKIPRQYTRNDRKLVRQPGSLRARPPPRGLQNCGKPLTQGTIGWRGRSTAGIRADRVGLADRVRLRPRRAARDHRGDARAQPLRRGPRACARRRPAARQRNKA